MNVMQRRKQVSQDRLSKEEALRLIKFAFNRAKYSGIGKEECGQLDEILHILQTQTAPVLFRGFGDAQTGTEVADAEA